MSRQPSPYSDASDPASPRGEPYIRTMGGRRIYVRGPVLNPAIHLVDIAYGLARINRYTGQTRHRYSVASHCLMVADLLGSRWARSGLLHDAVEAVLGDVSSPLKSLLPDYRRLERRWSDGMAERWGVVLKHPVIKTADRLAYAIERRDLCAYEDSPAGWDIETDVEITPSMPRCLDYAGSPSTVAMRWLERARELGVPEVA